MHTETNKRLFSMIYHCSMRAKGISFGNKLKDLMESQYASPEELESLQLTKLRALMAYARCHIPHYQDDCFIEPHKLSDIQRYPFLTKEIIKTRSDHLLNKDQRGPLIKKTTAGSTGEPFSLWKNNKSLETELANTWRGYSWAGISPGDKQARFWGIPLQASQVRNARIIDLFSNRKRVPASHVDDDSFHYHTKQLMKFQPSYFYGYVSSLVAYANYIQKHFRASPFHLKAIVTTSEILTESSRKLLESTFNTRVYDEYGCAEFGTVAHACEQGSLHVAAENFLVEVVNEGIACPPGEVGELVITELSNYAMPLIRYRTGDMGSIPARACSCGRQLPVIEGITGRARDMLVRKDGNLCHPTFFHYIFDDAQDRNLGILQYKVYQTDYQRFSIHIVPGPRYSLKTEAFVRGEVMRAFDPDATVEFVKVKEIARERSGKMRQVVGMDQVQTTEKDPALEA